MVDKGQDLNYTAVRRPRSEGIIKSTTTEIVGDSSGGRLVDDTEVIEAGDRSGRLIDKRQEG